MDAEKMLYRIAEGGDYETEYDGRTYFACRYCDAIVKDNGAQEHHDCMMLQAREMLGEKWDAYLKVKEERRIAKEKADKEKWERENAHRIKNSQCSGCGKMFTKFGLKQHKQTSVTCKASKAFVSKETRLSIKQAEKAAKANVVNGCLNCGKEMGADAHVNKKFCSNKGKGNCKDAYNNKQGGRLVRAQYRAKSQHMNDEGLFDDFEYGHVFASGDDGHGQH